MPPKRIPKPLKKAILRSLISGGSDALHSAAVADRVNNDPDLPASMKKTPKQMAYMLNRMKREYPEVIQEEVLSRNGTSHHGTERFRKAYRVPSTLTLAEAEQSVGVTTKTNGKKQITVLLSPKAIEYIREWKMRGLSAGQIVEQLIQNDLEHNGLPSDLDQNADSE